MSRLKKATDEFIYKNEARISGYVVSKRTVKNGCIFYVSTKKKKNQPENSNSHKEIVCVYFEGALAKYYYERFKAHDLVIVNGVVQNTFNQKSSRSSVRIYGLSMTNRKYLKVKLPDFRRFHVRGKITQTVVVNNDVVLVFLHTNVHKNYKNPNKSSEVKTFENDYVSDTPIAIYRNFDGGHDAKLVEKELTKGTWLDITGRINSQQKVTKDGKTVTEQNLVSYDIFRIGELQRYDA